MIGPSDHDRQRRYVGRLGHSLRALDWLAALCPACHHEMPGIDGAVLAVSVAHAGWIILSDSGPDGDQLEDLHATLREGPHIDTTATGRPVAAADLAQAHTTWPRFAGQAVTCGIRAVFAFPVQLDTAAVGILSVYRATAGPLSAADHNRLSRYAHTAAVLIRVDAHLNDAGQADMPLPSNAGEVQQAVGVVMQHATVDAPTALHRLRAHAHHSRRPMRVVVAEVRTGHLPFDPTTTA